MSSRGSITLGELEGKVTMLDIACHRCERRGRVSLARLIEEHGADMGLPDLWESLAGDCEHARSTAVHNRCATPARSVIGYCNEPSPRRVTARDVIGFASAMPWPLGCTG